MALINEIPERFWSLFRSVNRSAYMDALQQISEAYEYSNYFLSREACVQILSESLAVKRCVIWQDELEDELDALEPPATRVLNWLLKAGWLRKVEDYASMTANIVIPDYSAILIDAFARLSGEGEDETRIYIQNIYAVLFSLKNDARAGASLLDTALVNTRRLNKALQDMLHNMDKFFGRLLEKNTYGGLLRDHLEGYVEEVVRGKYHILKTSDNFYLYKTDIKYWLSNMREDEAWLLNLASKSGNGLEAADVAEKLTQIERGFDDIEYRITNMDREHSRYVRATVTRLNYLLNQEDDTKGLMIRLLNRLSEESTDERLGAVAESMNLSHLNILSENSLYKPRRPKSAFTESVAPEEEQRELTTREILDLNRVKSRYSRREIEEFVESRMENGRMEARENTVSSDMEFEKLILAYDYSTRQKSPYRCEICGQQEVDNGRYRYPKLVFVKKNSETQRG